MALQQECTSFIDQLQLLTALLRQCMYYSLIISFHFLFMCFYYAFLLLKILKVLLLMPKTFVVFNDVS